MTTQRPAGRNDDASGATHAELIVLAAKWLRNHCNCSVIITDMTSASPETPDAIGWKDWRSTLVECKTSRADFLADRKKHFRRRDDDAMGSNRYFLAPEGVLTPADLPERWGLLETDARRVSVVVEAPTVHGCRKYEMSLLISALRRMVCQEGVRGVACKTYVIEPRGEPRATVTVQREESP